MTVANVAKEFQGVFCNDQATGEADDHSHALIFIDYKSLGVRHLGSIYEGLLEFKLRIAPETMAVVEGKRTEGSYLTMRQSCRIGAS